mgnify:CR=1 FL=1|jgi:hypothetical protein
MTSAMLATILLDHSPLHILAQSFNALSSVKMGKTAAELEHAWTCFSLRNKAAEMLDLDFFSKLPADLA